MKQEPVGWAIKHQEDLIEFQTDRSDFEETIEFYKTEGWEYEIVPLYTAPRELSDEEITQVFDKCYPNNGDGDVVTLVDFARAIEKEVVNKNTYNIQQDDEMSINMCINKDFVNKND